MNKVCWRFIDEGNRPTFITDYDECVYAREHYPGGFNFSESNQYLFNFKKPLKYKNTNHWHYKIEAIKLFAKELSFLNFPMNSVIIPAPTSKPKSSDNHDSRIYDTLKLLLKYRPDLIIQDIIDVTKEIPNVHSEQGSRLPEDIKKYLSISDFYCKVIPKQVLLLMI